MIPGSLIMPIMSNGESVAPPDPMSWDADRCGLRMQVTNAGKTLSWLTGATPFTSFIGSNVVGNSKKATGKWQYTMLCDISQFGISSGTGQTQAIFGITKPGRWVEGTFGWATYDYAAKFLNSDTDVIYATNNNTDTVIISGAGATNDAGDYITVLVDFDAGKIWFAINGTVVNGGNPNTGTSPQFTFTAGQEFTPCCSLTRNGGLGSNTPGTYTLQDTLIYGTWVSFELWDNINEDGSDVQLTYDPSYSSVSLLLVADGLANGSSTLNDLSDVVHTITNSGVTVDAVNDVLNDAEQVCGTGNFDFVSTGPDFFTTTPMTEFIFGTSDFTVEFYFFASAAPASEQTIYDNRNSATSTNLLTFVVRTTGFIASFYSGAYRHSSNVTVCNGVWHHIAFSRVGDNFGMFVDGVRMQNITGASGLNLTANALSVGRNYIPGGYLNAKINLLRVTKGVGRYSNSFVPPRYWLAS